MPSPPLTAVIVLHWNKLEFTIPCYESLIRMNGVENLRIIIVDNGSTAHSPELLPAKCPQAEIIRLDKNYGFAGGMNRGIEAALTGGAEIIWLLNNDTLCGATALMDILDVFASDPKIGAVASKLVQSQLAQEPKSPRAREPLSADPKAGGSRVVATAEMEQGENCSLLIAHCTLDNNSALRLPPSAFEQPPTAPRQAAVIYRAPAAPAADAKQEPQLGPSPAAVPEQNSALRPPPSAFEQPAPIIRSVMRIRPPFYIPQLVHGEDFPDQREAFLCGASLAVRADVIRKVGMLDDGFPFFFEDADWSFRIKKEGLLLAETLAASVTHTGSASISCLSEKQAEFYRRGHLRFLSKHVNHTFLRAFPPFAWRVISCILHFNFAAAKGNIRGFFCS